MLLLRLKSAAEQPRRGGFLLLLRGAKIAKEASASGGCRSTGGAAKEAGACRSSTRCVCRAEETAAGRSNWLLLSLSLAKSAERAAGRSCWLLLLSRWLRGCGAEETAASWCCRLSSGLAGRCTEERGRSAGLLLGLSWLLRVRRGESAEERLGGGVRACST